MPCDSTIKITVDLKVLNRAILQRGLEREGWSVVERRGILYAAKEGRSIEIHKDRAVVVRGNEEMVNDVYDAFNREFIRTQVKSFGAKLESVPGQANKWKVTLPQFSKTSFTSKSSF